MKQPSFIVSTIPFIVLVVLLALVIRVFGDGAMDGASQVALLAASGVVVAISMGVYHTKWEKLEEAMLENFKMIGTSIVILLLIGAIAGTWMVSGVVPTLICYGMNIITPKIFLFAACLICALVSIMTGSSWTTIATLGVALMGIGTAQGYSEAWVAGAIISGAYFGDKVSPLSDTTTLASSSSGTALFTHIRYMMKTTVPSFAVAVVIYFVASLLHNPEASSSAADFSEGLKGVFNISPWLLIVPVLTGVLIARKTPAIITLFCAAVMGSIAALIAQPQVIWHVATGNPISEYTGMTFMEGFKGLFQSIYSNTSVDTGIADLNDLVSTRGMAGMMSTIFLIFSATTFGGTLTGSGMIQSITYAFSRFAHKAVSLVGATVGTGVFCNMVTGDQYLSIVLTSSMYKKLYEDNGYQHRLLSRSVEDSATVTSVLIPWNSCGMTQATVLGVATLAYLPYCFFNLISPFMSIFVAAIGYKIKRIVK